MGGTEETLGGLPQLMNDHLINTTYTEGERGRQRLRLKAIRQ